MAAGRKQIKVWSHRGASGKGGRPENTIYAFEQAIKEGADGIETDLHLSKDDVVMLLHDESLDRTTTGKGRCRDFAYEDLKELRSLVGPPQPIPTLDELLDLLMRPDNLHVEVNLDCKPTNDPWLLFAQVHKSLCKRTQWRTTLAPRIVLGLWHPSFQEAAERWLPTVKRTHLGGSSRIARQHFWQSCAGFSLYYSALRLPDGQAFLRECKEAGKMVVCWTANDVREFQDCYEWDVDVIITDYTKRFVDFRQSLMSDDKALKRNDSWLFSQYLNMWHSYEAAKDERWQYSMITEVNAIKHPPSEANTPELSPSFSADSDDLNLPSLTLTEAAITLSKAPA